MEWINIKDETPEAGIYLVVADKEPLIAFWYGDVWLSSEKGDKLAVTHWAFLPDAPKDL